MDNTKTVALYDDSCNLVVSASVDISAHDGTDKFTAITPTVLSAEATYHCVFNNPNGRAFAYGSVPTHTAVASITQDVWAGTVGIARAKPSWPHRTRSVLGRILGISNCWAAARL